jgi:tRNA(Ile)-lysidine synthase
MGPHPAVAAVRHAVRASLTGLVPGELVLAACSGGADSLALAAAAAFEAPRAGLRAGGVIIDHGLQPGSSELTGKVAATLTGLGLDPVLAEAVTVARPGDAGAYQGPEAAARAARYAALDAAAAAAGAAAILLGHTLDDQAETVLLGLARGSGARSLAGMSGRSGGYLRPLLQVRRTQTRAACTALGLQPWDDPHNRDPAFTRVRVRQDLMPALESALGPGVAEALARTARLLRADADALDLQAAHEAARIRAADSEVAATAGGARGWPAAALAELPAAIRHRILRMAALEAGCPAGALTERHIARLDELVVGWHGQRWADLPGRVRCLRRYGRLLFTVTEAPPPVCPPPPE